MKNFFDHNDQAKKFGMIIYCFCPIIWSVIGLINGPGKKVTLDESDEIEKWKKLNETKYKWENEKHHGIESWEKESNYRKKKNAPIY